MNDAEKLTDKIARAEAQRRLLHAIEEELTPKVRGSLLEFAKRRVRMLGDLGVGCIAGDAAAFVHDAIADTMIGELTWAPGVPIQVHLHGVIQSRTARLAERQKKAPHDTMDGHDEAGALGVVPGPEARYAAREALGHLVAWLATAGADAEVMRLVAAYRDGAQTRAQAAAATGLTVDEIRSARRRLDRLVAAMPGEAQADDNLSQSGTW